MHKIWFKLGKVGGFVLILLLLLFLLLFKRVDWTPYQETAYFTQTMERLGAVKAQGLSSTGDTIKVGWAKVNITPPQSLPLAGYGKRKGKHFEEVYDSVFVRAFVFDNGIEKAALVTIDLLVMPPEVTKLLSETLPASFPLSSVFLTATHSHSSFGGWAPGLVGKLFAGSYDHIWVEFITEAIVRAITTADSNKIRSKVGYAAIETQDLVYNRLEEEKGSVDPWLRILKIEQDSGGTAFFATFAAHPTILRSSFLKLSGEYPGVLVRQLESSPEIDFAAFGAGAMASQGPILDPGDFLPQMDTLALELANQILLGSNLMLTQYEPELGLRHLQVDLREPHWRVFEEWRVRPWVFASLFGEYPAQMDFLQIGQTLLVGTPCDFSGELVAPLDEKARAGELNLMITSFNGGYIGYITKDEWYNLNAYETRLMNWYGPYNGAYLSQIIDTMLEYY